MSRTASRVALCIVVVAASLAAPLGAQSVQYTSPAGVAYRALADTGPVARAQTALNADPRNVERIIALGIAQSGARQFREAIATFTRGLAIAPNNPMLYRWRGHRYLSVREFAKANADLTRGYQLDSTNYGILFHLGVLRYLQRDFSAAATLFAKAQPRAPNGGELAGSTDWRWLSLARAGRRAEGDAMLARRPDTIPAPPGYAYASRLRLYRGEVTPTTLFTPADTEDVQVATLSYGLGTWFLVHGDTAEAKAAFERAVKSGGWPGFAFMASEVELAALARASSRPTRTPTPSPYPHATEPIGTLRQSYDGALSPELAITTFRNIDRLLPTRGIAPSAVPRALAPSPKRLTSVSFTDSGRTYSLDDYLRLNRVAGLLVLKDGKVALERYQFGNTPRTRWMSMSVAKSVTSTLVGAALRDGYIRSLDDSVTHYVPVLAGSAYDGVTIRDVLLMASGVRWNETYTDPRSDRRRLLEAQISLTPGALMGVMRSLPRAAPPGTVNTYNTGETQVVGEIVRSAVGRPLATYLSERIWRPAGMEAEARWWLDSPDGVEIGGSGISATLRDVARFGQFVLERGVIGRDTVLPPNWTAEAGSPKSLRNGKRLDYGYLWWTGTTPAQLADHAFSAEGIHGQWLYINPARHVVIAVQSAQPRPTGGAVIDDWAFFDAVAAALK